jgi:hypothetical protein
LKCKFSKLDEQNIKETKKKERLKWTVMNTIGITYKKKIETRIEIMKY